MAKSVYVKGGDKLEVALKEISAKLSSGGTLTVGFYGGATYPTGGLNVPSVAAIQEFGAPRAGIPPRPFFRNMVAAHASEWPGVIVDQLKKTDGDANITLQRLGALISGQLRESIVDTNEPPLSPVTLMIRKIIGPNGHATFADVLEARARVKAGEVASGVSSKALVWTGHLLNSIDYEVDDEHFTGPRGGTPS